MRSLALLALLLAPVAPSAYAGDAYELPQSFASLTHLAVAGGAHVYYDPATTKVVNQPLAGSEMGEIVAVETRFGSDKTPWFVVFNPGPSDDPTFVFRKGKPDGDDVAQLLGDRLFLPGSSAFYVSGRTNRMFETRQKFTVASGGITEVRQPYYYVGLHTQVQNPSTHPIEAEGPYTVTLYADKAEKQVVAVLSSGSEIEVLLADEDSWYLVRTSFGLTGWVKTEPHAMKTAIGVSYAGD